MKYSQVIACICPSTEEIGIFLPKVVTVYGQPSQRGFASKYAIVKKRHVHLLKYRWLIEPRINRVKKSFEMFP